MNFLHKTEALVFCAILTVVFSFATAQGEIVDRIVANVNGHIILYSDLQNQIALLRKRMPNLDLSDPAQKSKIEHAVLEQMIQQKLADMEAKRLKINVTDAQVSARIQELMAMNHLSQEELNEKLAANGDSLQNMRKQIKESIARQELIQRVLKSQVVITDQEVDAYLQSQKGQEASTTHKIHLALIVLPVGGASGVTAAQAKQTGLKLEKELQGGADFKSLAIKYSKGPAAQQGGDVGYLSPDEVAPFMAKAIAGLKAGQVSDLVQGPDAYYIVKMLDVASSTINMSAPGMREKVRQMLYEQAMTQKYEQWLKNLESKAFIQISL